MPAAEGAYGKYHDRIYAGHISGSCSPHVCLAEGRTDIPAYRMAGKYPVYDSRMPLPYAPSDHVCKLSAVSAGGFPVCQEEALSMAATVPPADLSLQFLLFHLCFYRSWMVLVPDGRQDILERIICKTIYPLHSPCRGNGGSAPASYSPGAAGAQTERYGHGNASVAGAVWP